MPISFPNNPSANQTYTAGTKSWIWNGYAWDLITINASIIYSQANSAFDEANLAHSTANSAWAAANASYIYASSTANNAYNTANSAWAKANAANTIASSAYDNANSAYNAANSKFSSSGGTITGPVSIASSLLVTGNVTFSGNVTTVSANNLAIQDNMIYLNSGSTIANPDLGIVGNYNDGIYRHAGFFRDATDGMWKVFDQYQPEPDASPYIDTSNNTFRIADFQANNVNFGAISTSSTGLVSNLNSDYLDGQHGSYYSNLSYDSYIYSSTIANSAYNHSNSSYRTANSTYNQANSAYNHANSAYNHANSAYNQANTAVNNLSNYLPLTGGTLSGNLLLSQTDTSPTIYIINTNSSTNRYPQISIDNYGGTAGTGGFPVVELRKSRGTSASPTSVSSGDILGGFNTWGHNGSGFQSATRIHGYAANTFSTAISAGLTFLTTFNNSQAERMRIDENGNVGIGTSSIGGYYGKFTVGGSGSPTAGYLEGVHSNMTAPSSATYRHDAFLSTPNTSAAAFTLSNLRHYAAQQGTFGAGSTVTNQYGFYIESNLTGATNNYGFYSNIASGSGRYNFYAAGTADNYFAGAVASGGHHYAGLNVSTADAAVLIGSGRTSNGYSYIDLIGDTTYGTYGLRIIRNNSGPNASSGIAHRGTGSLGITTEDAGLIYLATNNIERARITSSGDVGIGTSSPGYKLDVVGQIRASTGFRSDHGTPLYSESTSTYGPQIHLRNYAANDTGPYYLFAKGRAGGTTSQSGDTLGTLLWYGKDTANTDTIAGYISMNQSAAAGSGSVPAYMNFVIGGSERARITSDGKVGIGTSSPSSSLTVNGGILARGGAPGASGINNNGYAFAGGSGDNDSGMYSSTDGQIEFYNNAIERMRINGSGQVVIGGVAPNAKIYDPQTTTARSPNLQLSGFNSVSAGQALISWDPNSGAYYAPTLYLARSSSSTPNTQAAVTSGTILGSVMFSGDDGTNFVGGALIQAAVDGTPGTNDMPGRLVFSTTADGASSPTERMRIDNQGRVSFGTSGPSSENKVSITGTLPSASYYSVSYKASGTVPSTSTTGYEGFASLVYLQSTSFNISSIKHFIASQPSAFSGGATATNQYGFAVSSNLTGATNNYGFYSEIPSGTGDYNFYAAGTADNYFAGAVGIGANPAADNYNLRLGGSFKSSQYPILCFADASIPSTAASGGAYVFRSQPRTDAASFSISALQHFTAEQGTFGAGSSVTNQIGFVASSNLTGATNNYGFYSNLASGTGRYNFYAAGTADNYFAGAIGIGDTALTGYTIKVSRSITGATNAVSMQTLSTIQSDVTSSALIFGSKPSTAAAAFTLGTLYHFIAEQGTVGAGSAVTNQMGFSVQSSLTGATNDYGFYSAIASGSGRYNFYAAGTADNYFAGAVGIGATSLAGFNLYSNRALTGATIAASFQTAGPIQSDVTTEARSYASFLQTSGATFSLGTATHYHAQQGSFTSATVTNQIGFRADASLTGATNNFGFYSNIASGSNRYNFYAAGTARNYFAGTLNLGDPTDVGAAQFNNLTISGSGGDGYGIKQHNTALSSVTGTFIQNQSVLYTQAASFTLNNYKHFAAVQGVIGAGSTVTSQYGFIAESNLTGATNNYGFYSNIASGSGRYNFYAAGTADNYFAGKVGFGGTSVGGAYGNVSNQIALTGATAVASYGAIVTINSDVTSSATVYKSQPTTQASAFTLSTLYHFSAQQYGFGAGSTVTSQIGYLADASLTSATNNYGFYSNIASGSGRFNFYAAGTADNYFAGNLLIGTTAAVGKLTVTTTSTRAIGTTSTVTASPASYDAQELVQLNNSSAISGLTFSGSDARLYTIGIDPDNSIYTRANALSLVGTNTISLKTAGTSRVHINSSGSVLVNQTTATNTYALTPAFLQVNEGLGVAQSINKFTNDANGGNLAFAKGRGSSTVNTIVQSGDALGSLVWVGADGTNYTAAAIIRAEVDGTPGTNDMPGRLVFSTTRDGASGTTEAFRINNSQSVLFGRTYAANERIGIGGGTSSISTATNANGITNDTTVSSPQTNIYKAYDTYLSTQAAAFTLTTLRHFSAAQSIIGAGSTVINQQGFFADGSMVGATNNYGFYSNIPSGSNRFNFYAAGTADNYFAGNVGIGIFPDASISLDISGAGNRTMRVWDFDTTGSTVATLQAAWGAGGGTTRVNLVAGNGYTGLYSTGASDPLIFATGNIERMRITSAGNVGIGTSSPSTWGKFAVVGASSGGQVVAAIVNTSGTANTQSVLSFDTTNNGFNVRDSQIRATNNGSNQTTLEFYTASAATPTEKMRIDNAGNVGIGTSGPTVKLQVAGSTTISSQANVAAKIGANITSDLLLGSINGNTPFIASQGAYPLVFSTNATERMRIDSSGKIGIGNTDTSVIQLRLSGNISGGTDSYGMYADGVVQSGVTSRASMFFTLPSTAAASFNLASLVHFQAVQGTFGAGSTVTTQYGFIAESNLTGATNNYGFVSNIPSGSNRYNFFAGGTADNYFAGAVGIGSTSLSNWYGLSPQLLVTKSHNAETMLGIGNPTVGASAQVGIRIIGGTGYSYYNFRLEDNNGSPYFNNEFGTAVNYTVWSLGGSERMRITSAGNVGIGTSSPSYKLQVVGSFAATTKSFVIDHPTKPDKKLRYGSLEGPENGVYIRGQSNVGIIELPEYWTKLVHEDSITVNLTAIGDSDTPRVKNIVDNKIIVFSKEGNNLDYFYTIFAERKDVEKLIVEF